MSTLLSLLKALCGTRLNTYDILFLGAHCCFLDEGFVLCPPTSTTSSPSKAFADKSTTTNPIRVLEDGTVVRMILPPNWNISNPLDQNYSAVYYYPPMFGDPKKDSLEVHLKAVVIGEKMAIHVVDTNCSDSLTTAVLGFTEFITPEIEEHLAHRNESIGQVVEGRDSAFAVCMDAFYNKIYSSVRDQLIKKYKEQNIEPSEKAANDESNSEAVPPHILHNPVVPLHRLRKPLLETDLFIPDGEFVGPEHAVFRNRNPWDPLRRARRPVIRFDPFNPTSSSGDPDPDDMPTLGTFPHIL